MPARLQPGHEFLRVEAHDRRDDARTGGEDCLALRVEIEQWGVARLGGHRRAPLPEELADARLVLRIAHRRRVGDPQIDLERAVALAAELRDPFGDPVGRRRQRAEPAHAAGIGDGGGKRRRAGAGHRRLQDRHPQPEMPAEFDGALARAVSRCHLSPFSSAIQGNGGGAASPLQVADAATGLQS